MGNTTDCLQIPAEKVTEIQKTKEEKILALNSIS